MPWPPHLVDAGVVFLALCFRSAEVVVHAQPSDFSTNFQNEVAGLSDETMFKILECWNPCANNFTGNEIIPSTDCKYYHECWYGQVRCRKGCGAPLVFNTETDYCDFATNVDCFNDEVECPDTVTKAPSVTPLPAPRPTPNPTYGQETTVELPVEEIIISVPGLIPIVIPYIEAKKDLIEKLILISYNGATGLQFQSTQYTYNGLLKSLQIMGVDGFGADFKFNLWEGNTEKWVNGLVNLAAFLANAMVESIEDDTCDELNWQKFEGKHAISNSCGQEGRSYEDDNCVLGTTEFMSCDVDPNMYVTAVTSGSQLRAPPPLKCKPGNGEDNHAGYWDFSSGRQVTNAPWANVAGRTDIEGCCWWGRGALATRGICNIGKINYYLGKRGAQVGRDTLYPDIDWCKYPEATCGHAKGEQIRWTTAMLEWSERVQRYETIASSTEGKGWNFEEQLQQFIESGLESESFIDGISRIFSRGCHKPGCSDKGEARMLNKRRSHFFMIVNDVFDIKSVLSGPAPTSKPTRPPVTPFVPVGVLPPAGSQAGVPSTGQYGIANPTDMQQNNPNQPSWLGGNPSQAGPSWNNPQPSQVIPPSPVSQPGQSSNNGGEKPTSWLSSNNNGEPSSSGMNGNPSPGTPNNPVSQSINEKDPESSQNNGVNILSSLPTYEDGGQLVGLESIASRLSAMHIFPWLLSATIVAYYYPL